MMPVGKQRSVVNVPSLLGGLMVAFALAGSIPTTALGVVLPIALDGLDATASPDVGTQFPAVDVNGLLGPAGANLYFSAAQIGLWTESGNPEANLGQIDLLTSGFALNWGARATFDVFNSNQQLVGFGEILEVLPESGTFDIMTGLGTSATGAPVPGSFILRNLANAVVFNGDKSDTNINNFAAAPDGAGGFNGTFLAGNAPELTILLPAEMGGALLLAELAGSFHLTVIPEPSSAGLGVIGGLLVAVRRRTISRRP